MKSQSFSTYSVAQSATPTPQKSPKVSNLFKRNRGSIRSNQSSGGDYSGSRQSLDSAGFETQGGARESSSRNTNLQECNYIFIYPRTIKNTIILYSNYLPTLKSLTLTLLKSTHQSVMVVGTGKRKPKDKTEACFLVNRGTTAWLIQLECSGTNPCN